MPQDGSNNYQYPPGTPGIPDQTIESEAYNTFLDDLVVNDLNIPRPIHRGGTAANNANKALINLSAEKATQLVNNYDAHVWMPGSFYSVIGATNAPVADHAFTGICYSSDPIADPPANLNLVVEARDQTEETPSPGRLYAREKKAGIWGAWVEQAGGLVGGIDDRYVNATGDTMTGTLIIKDVQPGISLDKTASGGNNVIFSRTNNIIRWALELGGTQLEEGGNSGSNLALYRYGDAGDFLGYPLLIDRATGAWTVNGDFVSTGGGINNWQPKIGITASNPRCAIEWGHSNPAYHATLGAHEGGGTPYISFTCGPGTDPNTFMTSTAGAGSTIEGVGGITYFRHVPLIYTNNQTGVVAASIGVPNAASIYSYGTGTFNVWGGISANNLCTFYGFYVDGVNNRWEPGGNLVISGNGFKPGGGDWADSSDERIKTVIGEYEHGLAEIMQVRPVRYVFKDNVKVIQEDLLREREDGSKPALEEAAMPMHEKEAAAQTPFIGVVAQEIEIPLPETVSRAIGFIDGKSVTDLRIYDSSALVYALINAVKELAARVEQLEAAR